MKRFISLLGVIGIFLSQSSFAQEVSFGAHYVTSGLVNPGTNYTLIPASANTSGISIKTLNTWTNANVQATVIGSSQIYASYPDGSLRLFIFAETNGTTAAQLPYPILLPAGVGLVIGCSGNAGCGAATSYDIH